jgi:cob(I)alamin adenosyltransferase
VAEPFQEPRVGLSRIYTRTGDAGTTGLVGGQRVQKDDLRIEAYGTVDELNSWVGLARSQLGEATQALAPGLVRVQHQLFNLGSCLATLPADLGPRQPRTADADIAWLESEIDAATAQLPALRSFVLPGGARTEALLHVARTVCRRAERLAVALERQEQGLAREVRYLNRLSDALFTWSRLAAKLEGRAETLWEPNRA